MKNVKVTQEQVDNEMKNYIVKTEMEFGKPVTYVTVRMSNGFTLRESTTCVDPANYSEEIGAKICLEKIEDKVWFLLGYALQDRVSSGVIQDKRQEPANNKFVPKRGDIISVKFGNIDGVAIVKSCNNVNMPYLRNGNEWHAIDYYVLAYKKNGIYEDILFNAKYVCPIIKPASEDEIDFLFKNIRGTLPMLGFIF